MNLRTCTTTTSTEPCRHFIQVYNSALALRTEMDKLQTKYAFMSDPSNLLKSVIKVVHINREELTTPQAVWARFQKFHPNNLPLLHKLVERFESGVGKKTASRMASQIDYLLFGCVKTSELSPEGDDEDFALEEETPPNKTKVSVNMQPELQLLYTRALTTHNRLERLDDDE